MIINESDCPIGWRIASVQDVLNINTSSLSSSTDPKTEFRYISIECVEEEKIDLSKIAKTNFEDAPSRARRIVKNGDLLFSTVRPNLKSFAVFKKPFSALWIASTGFAVANAKDDNDQIFFFYQLLSSIGARTLP